MLSTALFSCFWCCMQYFLRPETHRTVQEICDEFRIIPPLLYRWKKAFKKDIDDFSALATMMGLKSLNLYMTGLDSLELLSNLKNLELLVVGDNPISDLEPVKGMTNLRYLSIQNTGVQSLEALRHLERLETLNISELGSISLEPLYGHKNLREIMTQGTEISEDDKVELADIVHSW